MCLRIEVHTIIQEEITYSKISARLARIYQQKPGECVWKGILRLLDQIEQSAALGCIKFIGMGVLSRDSGFNALTHEAGSGPNSLLGKLTET